MAWFLGFDPTLATILLLALNGVLPVPRPTICIPAGVALGWAAIGPVMLGTAIGFVLGFGLARFALRETVMRRIAGRPRLSMLMQAVDQEGWRVLALMRLGSPVPGPVINFACGVTRMGFGVFMLTGLVAVLPQTVLFVYLGHAGGQVLANGSPFGFETLTALAGIVLTLVALWRIAVAAKRQAARIATDRESSAA